MKSPASTYRAALFLAAAIGAIDGELAWADAASVPAASKGSGHSIQAADADEMWLAVALNGQVTGTTALVRYDHAGNLWVGEEELRTWRLPAFSIGSMVKIIPGCRRMPLPGVPKCSTCGSPW